MLQIDIYEDEAIQDVLKKFISSVLPHDNYDSAYFTTNLSAVLKYVHLDEFTLEYSLLLKALSEYCKLKIHYETFEPKLSREAFNSLVEASLMELIVKPEFGAAKWLEENGMDFDLRNEVSKENACQAVWERAMDLYDECFELEIPSNEAINYELELRESFQSLISAQAVNSQVKILRGKVRIGRHLYQGFDGWRDYVSNLSAEISQRLNNADDSNTIVLDSLEKSKVLFEQMKGYFEPLAPWGIPQLDCATPMMRHRMVVVVGKENIGKTKFAINSAVQALLAGRKVVYMCGETEQAAVYTDILINYIYRKYGKVLRPQEIYASSGFNQIDSMVAMSVDELIEGKALVLQDSFSYETAYQEFQTLYETTKFDVMFIDHSCALTGSVGDGSLKAKIDKLAEDVKNFRKYFPVCIVVNSHPSTTAKAASISDKSIEDSPTKGSQDLSVNADDVYILRDNESLRKQGLVKLENTKRRNAPVIKEPIYLEKAFHVSAFNYNEDRQSDEVMSTEAQQETLKALVNLVEDTDDSNLIR